MLDKIYKKSLEQRQYEVKNYSLPELVRFCRELMGLKQFACSEHLGFETARYKRLELGRLKESMEAWEIHRLQKFFQLPSGVLEGKERAHLAGLDFDRKDSSIKVWNEDVAARGERMKKAPMVKVSYVG